MSLFEYLSTNRCIESFAITGICSDSWQCASQSIPLLFNETNMIAHSPADQPVIIVTIEYRLGVLADMYLEELVAEDPQWPTAGNDMYLDTLSALRWIKKNIGDYRGDSDRISIFGASAGGLSVIDLGAIRGSAGLYHAAISQSGLGSPGTYSSYYNKSNALNYSQSLVQRLNCTCTLFDILDPSLMITSSLCIRLQPLKMAVITPSH